MKLIIPDEEYRQRLDKIRGLLKREKIDGLIVTPGVNFRYLLKYPSEMRERLTAAVITPGNSVELICPAFEVNNFVRSTPLTSEQIQPWEETENPYKLLKEVCGSIGLTDGTVALSPETPFTIYSKMRDNLSKISFVDAYPIFRASRMHKTERELELLKKANEVTAAGIEATFDSLQEGMTEKQIARILEKELTSRSGEPLQFAAVQIGENTAHPHGLPTDKKLRKNEVVLIDAGTSIEG
ncbi:MAG: M24 family metallopeptidase, partial [Candidatus Hodarchaeales archaeon]